MKTTTDIGQAAETVARQHLESQGLKLIETNYRCRHGEIDIIMQEKQTVVFVEVRYRSNPNFGTGAESVDARKQQKLIASASHYLQKNKLTANQNCRFDVVSLSNKKSNEQSNNKSSEKSVGTSSAIDSKQIQWIKNAIEA